MAINIRFEEETSLIITVVFTHTFIISLNSTSGARIVVPWFIPSLASALCVCEEYSESQIQYFAAINWTHWQETSNRHLQGSLEIHLGLANRDSLLIGWLTIHNWNPGFPK